MAGMIKSAAADTQQYARTVLRDLGLLLHIPGCMAAISLPVCLIAGEFFAAGPFLRLAVLSLEAGQGLARTFKHAREAQLRHAVVTVALGWGLLPFFGAILLIGIALANTAPTSLTLSRFQAPLNALFEAVSGFTSTGLSMALDSSRLPVSLQWWRSLMEWVGGVGVIVLMISVLEPSTDRGRAEAAAGSLLISEDGLAVSAAVAAAPPDDARSAGLSVGITSPKLPAVGKLVLMLFMWMGRLEIIPVLALIVWPMGMAKRSLSQLWHRRH